MTGKTVAMLWPFCISKMAVSRHLGFYRTANSAIRSAVPDPENRSLEPNTEWIGCTVCEIFTFKLYCDLETGVRVTQGHQKWHYLIQHIWLYKLYSSSIVTISVVRYPRYHDTYRRYLCIYVCVPVLPRSRYIAIYRSSKKYGQTAQLSTGCTTRQRVHTASQRYRNELNSHGKAMSVLAAVTKYTVSYFFSISSVCAALAY